MVSPIHSGSFLEDTIPLPTFTLCISLKPSSFLRYHPSTSLPYAVYTHAPHLIPGSYLTVVSFTLPVSSHSHCGSFLDGTIPSHHPLFLSPPTTMAPSWKIPCLQYHPYSCLLSTITVAHCQKIPSPRPCILPVAPPTTTYLSHCGSFLEDTITQQAIHPSYSPTSTMAHSWKIPPHQTTYLYCLPPCAVVHSWKILSSHTVYSPPSTPPM